MNYLHDYNIEVIEVREYISAYSHNKTKICLNCNSNSGSICVRTFLSKLAKYSLFFFFFSFKAWRNIFF